MEAAVETYDRGRQVLARFPDAQRIIVPSHHNIPTLYGNEGNAEDWLRIKQERLVLGVKKSMSMRPNDTKIELINGNEQFQRLRRFVKAFQKLDFGVLQCPNFILSA